MDHQRAEAALIALTPVPGVLPKAVLPGTPALVSASNQEMVS